MTILRKSGPESPQEVSCLLVGFGAGDGVNLITSRIEGTCDTFYISTLTSCVPAFVSDDDGNSLAVELVMQGQFGNMVILDGNELSYDSLENVD